MASLSGYRSGGEQRNALRRIEKSDLATALLSSLRGDRADRPTISEPSTREQAAADPELRAWCLVEDAMLMLNAGFPAKSRTTATHALGIIRSDVARPSHRYPIWMAHRLCGIASYLSTDFDQAQESLSIALGEAWLLGEDRTTAITLLDLGELAMRHSDFAEAQRYFFDARELARHGSIETVATHSIGDLFHANGDWETGNRYHQKARQGLALLSPATEARLRTRYAAAQSEAGNLIEARREMDIALNLIEPFPDVSRGPVWLEEASLLAAENRYVDSEHVARRAVQMLATAGDKLRLGTATEILVAGLLRQARLAEALAQLNATDTSALLNSELERFLRLQTTTLRRLKRWREASRSHDQLVEVINQRKSDLGSFHDGERQLKESKNLQRQNDGLDEKVVELEEMRRDRDELVKIMAQDIKRPLQDLQQTVRRVAADHASERPIEARVNEAALTIGQIKQMTHQLATAGELDAGRIAISLLSVDIPRLLQTSAYEHQTLADAKRVQLVVSSSQPIHLDADLGLLGQVISNLLTASIRQASEGSTVMIRALLTNRDQAVIQMSDNGRAMAKADRNALFSKHARFETRPGESANGLGLYVARQLMFTMGGSVCALPQHPEGGTTFQIAFASRALTAPAHRFVSSHQSSLQQVE